MERLQLNLILLPLLLVGLTTHCIYLSPQRLLFITDPLIGTRCFISLIATIGLLYLNWQRHPKTPPSRPRLLIAGGTAAALAPLFLGQSAIGLSALSLGLLIWSLTRLSGVTLSSFHPLLLIALAAQVYPLEAVWAPLYDPYIQFATTFLAGPLVTWTGFPVEVADIGGPLLLGDNHYIYVTSLCAGFKTSLSLITLGIVLGVYFLEESKKQLAFSLFVPLIGHIVNVIRITVSAHAAHLWLTQPNNNWDIAHDVIGYGAFFLNYVALFLIIYLLRRTSATTDVPPQITESDLSSPASSA
ncbi:MAG: archaeosortase/exosortase family protein [Myxococcota bacterium]|nr:archaeosortase/exosortase family protein [Myxococcota bacterium]